MAREEHAAAGGAPRQPPAAIRIPKVREQLRGLVGSSSDLIFTPQAVAIGPYHRRSDAFPWTEKQKTDAVEFIKEHLPVHVLEGVIAGLVRDAIACYDNCDPPQLDDDPPQLDDDPETSSFRRMLLRDGCFLLGFFIPLRPPGAPVVEETETKDNTMLRDILYLRENQIPLFVLDRMFEHITGVRSSPDQREPESAFGRIAEAVRQQMEQQYYIRKRSKTVLDDSRSSSSSHILHLVHSCLRRQRPPEPQHAVDQLPRPRAGLLHRVTSIRFRFGRRRPRQREQMMRLPGPGPEQPTATTMTTTTTSTATTTTTTSSSSFTFRRQQQAAEQRRPLITGRWRRATEYARCGNLGFSRRDFDSGQEEWSILDIHYRDGTLYIPLLRVDSSTWTMLRNLMVLEEQEMEERPVTAYCFIMSQLACTPEDVQLLQRAKILEHFLGSDDRVAQGFADLCDGIALDIDSDRRNYLKPVWHRLEARCANSVNHFKGLFREKYCTSMFYRFVFFVAFILFVCQLSQAIYTALAYHKPQK